MLDDVTKLLPDDTWLTQLDVRSAKGQGAATRVAPARRERQRGPPRDAPRGLQGVRRGRAAVADDEDPARPRRDLRPRRAGGARTAAAARATREQRGPGFAAGSAFRAAASPAPVGARRAGTRRLPHRRPRRATAPRAPPALGAAARAADAERRGSAAAQAPPGMMAPRDIPPPPGSVSRPSAGGPPTSVVNGEQVLSSGDSRAHRRPRRQFGMIAPRSNGSRRSSSARSRLRSSSSRRCSCSRCCCCRSCSCTSTTTTRSRQLTDRLETYRRVAAQAPEYRKALDAMREKDARRFFLKNTAAEPRGRGAAGARARGGRGQRRAHHDEPEPGAEGRRPVPADRAQRPVLRDDAESAEDPLRARDAAAVSGRREPVAAAAERVPRLPAARRDRSPRSTCSSTSSASISPSRRRSEPQEGTRDERTRYPRPRLALVVGAAPDRRRVHRLGDRLRADDSPRASRRGAGRTAPGRHLAAAGISDRGRHGGAHRDRAADALQSHAPARAGGWRPTRPGRRCRGASSR